LRGSIIPGGKLDADLTGEVGGRLNLWHEIALGGRVIGTRDQDNAQNGSQEQQCDQVSHMDFLSVTMRQNTGISYLLEEG
jgi:hypothetical protein